MQTQARTWQRSLVLLLLGLNALTLSAQEWGRFYQWGLNGRATRVSGHVMHDGRKFLASTQTATAQEVVVMMSSATGAPEWIRNCTEHAAMFLRAGEFPNGDPYVLWWTEAPERTLKVVRFDPYGNVVWKRSIPSAYPLSDEHGGDAWIVPAGTPGAGRLRILEELQQQAAILEIADNGDLLSYRAFNDGEPGWDFFATCMAPTSDGGIITCGQAAMVSSGPMRSVVHRFDASGALLWSQRLALSGPSGESYAMRETNDGNLLLSCSRATIGEVVAIKMLPDGAISWARSYLVEPANIYEYNTVLEDENGELLLVGDAGQRQSALHLNAAGELLGSVRYWNPIYANSRMLHYDWNAFRNGKVFVAGITSLEPICFFPETMGVAQFEGPAEQPLPCFLETESVTITDVSVTRQLAFPYSSWDLNVADAPGTFNIGPGSATHADLCTITSLSTSAGAELLAPSVSIWPNPASDHLRVQVPNAAHVQLQLYDVRGVNCPLQVTRGNAELLVDVGALARGVYLLQVTDGTASTRHRVVLR